MGDEVYLITSTNGVDRHGLPYVRTTGCIIDLKEEDIYSFLSRYGSMKPTDAKDKYCNILNIYFRRDTEISFHIFKKKKEVEVIIRKKVFTFRENRKSGIESIEKFIDDAEFMRDHNDVLVMIYET
jgi:hypothetical protein